VFELFVLVKFDVTKRNELDFGEFRYFWYFW